MLLLKNLISTNIDIIIIIRGGGSTTDISLSFDCISLFKCIKDSTVPIMTAIGHANDCDDQLLITQISDINYHTPTTAAKGN